MKRALLIAGGTVGGLGAVLSITPPQLESNGISLLSNASAETSIPAATQSTEAVAPLTKTSTQNSTQSATPTAAAVATKKATTTKKSATSSSPNASASTSSNASSTTPVETATPTPTATKATETPTPTPTPTKATPTPTKTSNGVSGSFTGDSINVGYGMVQVKITISNGRITDAVALQAPSGRSQRFTDYAVPNLRQQTLSAQSAAIRGVSGASYTSYGWYKSLISALQKAGMTTGV